MDSDFDFDVIVLGTGLTESITAAALSKAGFKVAHIDSNTYYGGDEASLSLDELIQWADDHSLSSDLECLYPSSQKLKVTSISRSSSTLPNPRQYCLSLSPSIIPSAGPAISSLVASGVSRYNDFSLLERVAIYDQSGVIKSVPGSKEDVFKSKSIDLLDKRRLMRFLMFAVGEFEGKDELVKNGQKPFCKFLESAFSFNEDMANAIAYSLAYCVFSSDPTLPTLQRLRRYLRSAGRYGASSFLVGHYGGLGEIAQGFCRSSAVSGGVYILGKNILSIDQEPKSGSGSTCRYVLKMDDLPHTLTCDLIISSRNYLPTHLGHAMKYMPPTDLHNHTNPVSAIARGIAIIDRPPFEGQVDASVLIFPPSSLVTGSCTTSVNVFITGERSKSAPPGKLIVYLSTLLLEPTSASPESLLRPYLDATLSSFDVSLIHPPFTIFYTQELPPHEPPPTFGSAPPTFLVSPLTSCFLAESSDSSATNAEAIFWEATKVLKSLGRQTSSDFTINDFWPRLEADIDEEW